MTDIEQDIKRLDVNDIACYLEERVVFQPFGQRHWDFSVEEEAGLVFLVCRNHFARDSRTHEFDREEEDDPWTYLDSSMQSTTIPISVPISEVELRKLLAMMAAQFLAHEALEWLRIDGEMPHDPHEDGDVWVKM